MASRDSSTDPAPIKTITCGDCGVSCPRRGPNSLFCEPCSIIRSRARQEKYRKEHPNNKRLQKVSQLRQATFSREFGLNLSDKIRWPIESLFPDESGMVWVRRVAVPFDIAFSKNYIYHLTDRGHAALRRDVHAVRDNLADAVAEVIRDAPVVQNKVWLDLLIEKPAHYNDAINLIASICDSIKGPLGVDDRWFCIRRLDWQIVKKSPRVLLGIGQDSDQHVRTCSHCGRLLPYDHYFKNRSDPFGVGRSCKDCRKGRVREKASHQ